MKEEVPMSSKGKKRGLSEMVAYAMMVAIALSLALIVYAWMKGNVIGEAPSCPDDISVIMSAYSCDPAVKNLSITLRNKGKFTIDGFIIKGGKNNTANYMLNTTDTPLFDPDTTINRNFSYSVLGGSSLKIIEVTPYYYNEKRKENLICSKAIISEKIENCN